MILLDSNILIYSAQREYEYLRQYLTNPQNSISAITYLEVLGYHALPIHEKMYYTHIFSVLQRLPLDNHLIEKAVLLRQQYKMKLGDSIIAATSLHYDLELYTRNTIDFQKIVGIKVHNPIL